MGMTERLLAAWRDASAAMDTLSEGTPEWERARLAAENASTAYQLHVAHVFDDVSGHVFHDAAEPGETPEPGDAPTDPAEPG